MKNAKKSRYKTALILAGGGSLGAFEVGALQVILEKIEPDVLIGTSVGSINAAAVATGMSIEEIIKHWKSIKKNHFFPLNRSILFKFRRARSIYSRKNLQNFIKKLFGTKEFSDCNIPLYINATYLKNGKEKLFSRGRISKAILASTALTPLYPPFKIGKEEFTDGGFSNYMTTDHAIALGCSQIIIVTPDYRGQPEDYHRNLFSLSVHLNHLLQYQLLRKAIELCGDRKVVVISPSKPLNIALTNFSHTQKLITTGKNAAKKVVKKIVV